MNTLLIQLMDLVVAKLGPEAVLLIKLVGRNIQLTIMKGDVEYPVILSRLELLHDRFPIVPGALERACDMVQLRLHGKQSAPPPEKPIPPSITVMREDSSKPIRGV